MNWLRKIILITLLLVTAKSFANPAFVQNVANGFSTSTFTSFTQSPAFSIPVSSGNLVICLFNETGYTAGSITSVTDTAGNTYTRAGTQKVGTGVQAGMYFDVWYAANVTGGTNLAVTFTFSASQTAAPFSNCSEYSGVATSGALDQISSGTTTSNGSNVITFSSLTTTSNNELIVGIADWSGTGGVTSTAGTGFTLRDGWQWEDKTASSPGSVAGTINVNSSGVQAVYWFLAFKAVPGTGTFQHVQGASTENSGTNTITLTLASNPTAGNVVACFYGTYSENRTVSSFKDANNNNYTAIPSTPINQSNQRSWGYYLIAPSNASKTITVTMSGTQSWKALWCDEFSASGGRIGYDKSGVSGGASSSGTLTAPSITPSSTRELMYSGCVVAGAIGQVNSPWIENPGGGLSGNTAAYVLNTNTTTSLNYNNGVGEAWSCISMAFRLVVGGFVILQ